MSSGFCVTDSQVNFHRGSQTTCALENYPQQTKTNIVPENSLAHLNGDRLIPLASSVELLVGFYM